MARKQTTPRKARTPREVLAPKMAPESSSAPRSGPSQPLGGPSVVEVLATMTPEQLAARAAELDQAREALKAAGDAAAAAQMALDALPNDATDEQRNDALNAIEDAEKAVKSAEAALQKASRPDAVASAPETHTPESEDQGGAGNAAGPAGGGHAQPEGGVLVVTTKRPSRWRAGRKFTKGNQTRIPLMDLSETQYRAIKEDPVLESWTEVAADTDGQ